jgi:hypothetical protein
VVPDALSRLAGNEIERDASKRAPSKAADLTLSPDDPLAKAHKKAADTK